MLTQKKIEKKKMIFYVLVIAIMLSLSFFLIVKSLNLNISPVSDETMIINSPEDEATNDPTSDKEPVSSKKDNEDLDSQEMKRVFDTGILRNDKFKELRDDSLSRGEKVEIGKRDPFSPDVN